MIKGMHGLFYSPKAEEVRAFFRDVLGFPSADVGDGWLIFDPPDSDFGVHPSDGTTHHEISFWCDDIEQTAADLRERGVQLSEIVDQGFGLVATFRLPDGAEVQLYEPRYEK